MAQQTASDFYWACRNGNIETVKKILPELKVNDINRIESNGSTALHAASHHGHANIVRLLLEHDADATILNKYGKTAKDEASTDEVRTIFKQAEDDDDDIPQFFYFQVYRNADGIKKSALATRIFKARLGTYQVHKYSISASSNIEHLEKRFCKICEQKEDTAALDVGKKLFESFRKTNNLDYMIQLYCTDRVFYEMIRDDDTFQIEMYKHLLQCGKYRVKEQLFRPLKLLKHELKFFHWLIDHPNSLIELQKFLSTTRVLRVAQNYIYEKSFSDPDDFVYVLLQIDLTQKPCFTTIQVSTFSSHPAEEEVLILPGTFFSVTSIEKANDNVPIVSLVHIPVDENVLSTDNKLTRFVNKLRPWK